MNQDYSQLLYQKYFSQKNRLVELNLINGRTWKGFLIGFYLGETELGENYIRSWIFVKENTCMNTGFDAFGNKVGIRLEQSEIISVKFAEDNSILEFK